MNAVIEHTVESNEQYHADRSYLSRSQLWEAWKRPRLFEAKYVTRTIQPERSSSAMDLGTAVHAAVLEDRDLVATYPADVLSKDGKASTAAAKEWRQEQESLGKIVLNKADAEDCNAMIASVGKFIAGWTRKDDIRERSLRWTDSVTGLSLKCRPDWIAPRKDFVAVMDLKTTAELTQHSFTKSCRDYGYWLQASLYSDAVVRYLNREDVRFWFVVVESSAPYVTAAFEFSAETLARSRNAQGELLDDIARRFSENDWSDPCQKQVTSIELPHYCFER